MIDRIAILGGSSVYIPEFFLSIVSHNVNVKEVVLQGRTEKKLQLVAAFCQRLLDRSGFPAKVIATAEVEEAVEGASYVLNHVRIGGMKARLRDEKLPPKYGMIGDETLGAGGIANALRTLPVVFDFAERIETINPDALIMNVTNPVSVCVEALTRYTSLKVLGVCDLPGTYVRKVARLLRHACDDMTIDYIGLNHMGWIQDIKADGRSLMSKVLERLEKQDEEGFDYELIELFRMVPTRTVGLFFHQDELLKKQRTCGRFRAEVLHEAEKQILKLYEDEHLAEVPDLTRARNAIWYEETIVPLIAAFESKKEKEFILCVRNDGAIRDLPDAASVEVPVRISKGAFAPRKVGSSPRFLKGIFLAVKESDRLVIEAVRHKSYEYALQALTIHPLVPSLGTAKKYLDRVIKEEKIELY